MAKLFDPIKLGSLELPNRIIIAPMCQYSATDGCMNDWHFTHVNTMALSGAGLFIVEATGVSPEGRISPGCTGLYDDATESAMARVLKAARGQSNMPIAIQLGHAGRKASSHTPFDGGAQIPSSDPAGWTCVAPSALAQGEGEEAPVALDAAGLAKVKADFVASALRAVRLGLTGSSCIWRMAICCISFFRRCPTSATTTTAARWKTACGSRWRCFPPFETQFRMIIPCGPASRRSTGSTAA